jgi:hypothetical protein
MPPRQQPIDHECRGAPQGRKRHCAPTDIEAVTMEVVLAVVAVAVGCSCLFFLVKSDSGDFFERRNLAKQKIARQQDKTIEGD